MQAEQLTPLIQLKLILRLIGDWGSFMIVLQGDLRSVLSSKPPFSDGTGIFFLPVTAKVRSKKAKS